MASLLTRPSARVALVAYQRIAQAWELSIEQGAVLLGTSTRTAYRWLKEGRYDRDRLPPDTLERISHLVAIWENLAAVFGDGELAKTWIRRPNVDFGDQPPLRRLLHGNVQDLVFVRTYLDRARQGW